jgi:hypothetical protein
MVRLRIERLARAPFSVAARLIEGHALALVTEHQRATAEALPWDLIYSMGRAALLPEAALMICLATKVGMPPSR